MAPIPEVLASGEYILLPDTTLLPWTKEGFEELTLYSKVFLLRFFTNLAILAVLVGVLVAAFWVLVGIQRQLSRLFQRRSTSNSTNNNGIAVGRFPIDETKDLAAFHTVDISPPEYTNCYRDDVRVSGSTMQDPALTGHSYLYSPSGIRMLHQRLNLMGPPDSPLRMRRLRQVSGAEAIN